MSLVLWSQHTKQIRRHYQIDSVVKRATPGLGCPPKLWWAKEITPDIHVSGRLTQRQLKYAAEGGFKSVICLDPDQQMTFAGETLPNSSDIKSISSLVGLQTSFIDTDDSVPDSKSVDHFMDIFPNISKPLLLTGSKGKSATFLALLYLAHQSQSGLDSVPKVTSEIIYRVAASLGFDFTDDVSKRIVAEVTGEDVIVDPPKPDLEKTPISDYWPAHRIGKNWYTAGQIRRQDLPFLESVGFKSLINMRMGVEYENKPSQEPVTLLNVKDSLGTYDKANNPTRLNPKILEENRVFPEISSEYVGTSPSNNYETINEDEFGDRVGYNEDLERDFVAKHSSLKYSHMPFPLRKYID